MHGTVGSPLWGVLGDFFIIRSLHLTLTYLEYMQGEYSSNLSNFIQILHVYITGHRKVSYIKVTVNSQ